MAKKVKKQQFDSIDVMDVKPGMQVRVHQKIKEVNAKGEEKERIQVFEGLILSRKHKNEIGATFTVRKISEGVGVEKTFPIHSPLIDKVELVDIKMVNRAKLYFTRTYKKRLKSASEKKFTIEPTASVKAPEIKKDVAAKVIDSVAKVEEKKEESKPEAKEEKVEATETKTEGKNIEKASKEEVKA